MKKTIIGTFIIVLSITSCKNKEVEEKIIITYQSELSQTDRDEIINTFMATKDAWNEGNLEEFMKGYNQSDDIAFVGASGPTYGYEATLKRYINVYPNLEAMGKLDFEVLKLYKIDTRTAIMIGKFYLTRTIGDQQGYYTLVWQKIDDNWKIISDHSSGGPVE
ncbi:MAG: nuclear transport factor 2 family protein [Bacteroidales bacterium]|nr:nuclear transport factor 2 family protein [Bacteroidales bacterium]